MDFKNDLVVSSRFNDAVYEIVMLLKAERNNDNESINRHKANAGRALYETIELALKNHIAKKGNRFDKESIRRNSQRDHLFTTFQNCKESIEEDVIDNVDYVFLMNKGSLINISKHQGDDRVDSQDLVKYLQETRKFILLYINDNVSQLKTIDELEKINIPAWDNFYSACDKFINDEKNYVLLIDNNKGLDNEYLKNLAIPKWDLIIDFDFNSKDTGFYNLTYNNALPKPTIINVNEKVDDDIFATYSQSHYHYFINSFKGSGIPKPLDYDNFSKYEGNFEKLIKAFSTKFSLETKIVIVSQSISSEYIYNICRIFRKFFKDKADFILAVSSIDDFSFAIKHFKIKYIPINISEIAEGLASFSSNLGIINPYKDKYIVPFAEYSITEGATGILTPEFYALLELDFEVLHKGLDTYQPEIEQEKRDFLSGYIPISWYGLREGGWDKSHPSLRKHIKRVSDALQNAKGKIELIHEAGYGGSTIARRIAWEMHEDYPTLILKEYRDNRTVQKLIRLHQQTRKTIFVVMEVPQSITLDNIDSFYRLVSESSGTRPFVFLIVRRGNGSAVNLTDWGNSSFDLINAYKPYLREYNDTQIEKQKEIELNNIGLDSLSYQKTPFYVGLVTFEKNFFAIKDYIRKFVEELKTEDQKKIILYLAIAHDYLGEKLPVAFFERIIKIKISDATLQLEKYLPPTFSSLIVSSKEGKQSFWQPRHVLFSKELKEQILRGNDSENQDIWKQGLADICIGLIEDSLTKEQGSDIIQSFLQKLFIGTKKDRVGEQFVRIIMDIQDDVDRARVFTSLKETYPDNPHFCSHLARFYGSSPAPGQKQRNRELAFQYADEAIKLSESEGKVDSSLYHIKGMCLRGAAYDLMKDLETSKRKGEEIQKDKINKVIYDLVPSAEREFTLSREVGNDKKQIDEYGYISHIQLLIKTIDFGSIISGLSKSEFLASNQEPYQEWIDLTEDLLEDVYRLNSGQDENKLAQDCQEDLDDFYERYSLVLKSLNDQLERGRNPTKIKRRIVRTYFKRKDKDFRQDPSIIDRILKLMQDNIDNEPSNEKNFFLWFQAARYSKINLADALSKVSKWKIQSTAIDSIYYLYILKVFSALEGDSVDAIDAELYIRECKKKQISANTKNYEWYGKGVGLKKLINNKELDADNKDVKLQLVRGFFTDFENSGVGYITLVDKLKVFFSPTQARLSQENKNSEVEFYLGFSYDGLRADSSSVRLVTNLR